MTYVLLVIGILIYLLMAYGAHLYKQCQQSCEHRWQKVEYFRCEKCGCLVKSLNV